MPPVKSAPVSELVLDVKRTDLIVRVEGDSELIMHKWSEKAKKQMLDKQTGKAPARKKDPKDPQQDYEDSIYYTEDGRYGFPAVAFKGAMVSAARFVDGLNMTFMRGAVFINGEFVPIEGEPQMREDMVRLNGSTADIRYRAGFTKWAADLPITINANTLTVQQVADILNLAGFSVGVGEWRPEKNGQYGRFRVTNVEVI